MTRLSADQRRILLSHPAGWIATGFGSGLSPYAPGTVGSAVALLPWMALFELSLPIYVLVIMFTFALGVWACGWVADKLHIADPQIAVWDEFVGLWIALIPLFWLHGGWIWVFAGFILFRIFDIAKPWPVSWADRNLSGGLGVMLDDVFAGIYAAIALAVVMWIVG
jgi:phosphatidylglycerophosphatase A